jgi:hypothetical protein
MLRGKLKLALAVAIALVALSSATDATFSVYVSPGLLWKGQWYWNTDDGSVVNVRVANTNGIPVFVVVDVKARAEDGTTVQGFEWLNIPAKGGREASVELDKSITSLQFTQVRRIR